MNEQSYTNLVLEMAKLRAELEIVSLGVESAKAQAQRSESDALAAKNIAEVALTRSQGGEIRDASEVFLEMSRLIEHRIKEQRDAGVRPQIHLRLLAVSMTYSWNGFITSKLVRLLNENPTLQIRVDALIVHHGFLTTKNIGQRSTNWARKSKINSNEAVDFISNECPNYGERITFNLRAYSNIPHWHGWLIDGEHLFLGRTDWENAGSTPILYVGTNEYRYFDNRDYSGERRIQLFRNWHSYYFNYDSLQVCEYPAASNPCVSD